MTEKQEIKTYRGTARIYQQTGQIEFTPQQQGEPQQEGIAQTRLSKLYKTTGNRPKIVAHLVANADTADAYADMLSELNKLYPADKQKPPRKPRGRTLLKDSDVALSLNQSERRLECRFDIVLPGCLEVSNKLLTIFQRINSCLAYNENFLKPLTRAHGKSSTK